MKKSIGLEIVLNILFIAIAIACVFPLLLTVGISLSSENSIIEYGYTLIPKEWSFDAYKYIVSIKEQIFSAYAVTIFVAVVGTSLSTLVIALYAYPLSRSGFKLRGFFTFYVFFTMLFSGGTVSWYIICTKVLNLSNTIWAMIVPYLMNAWYVLIMRTFYKTTIPDSLIESARLDGAGEYKIFFKIVLPLSLPGLATIALFSLLGYWNDWWLPLMFITEQKLYNLQFLLQSVMQNIQLLTENQMYMGDGAEMLAKMPAESARMALCIIAIGPILIAYPFFQKYFIQGLTIGAVKG